MRPKIWTISAGIAALAAVCAGTFVLLHRGAKNQVPLKLVYTSQGYGGYVSPAAPMRTPPKRPKEDILPLALFAAYNAGSYAEAKREAIATIRQTPAKAKVADREKAAQARLILAYSDARQKNLRAARTQFAALEQEAVQLPDRGKEPKPMGQQAPTLQAEAAYEHAVCTGALGDKKGAEAEYVAFMERFPESPLLNAAALRIMRMHGGNMPAADQAVWQQAKNVARAKAEEKMLSQARCGPECLAELLRRQGERADIKALAREAGTTVEGTSLQGLADAARQHGYSPRGVALTQKGLLDERFPAIALLTMQHYVIVEKATADAVTIWDPDARGVGHGARLTLPAGQWSRTWQGYLLELGKT